MSCSDVLKYVITQHGCCDNKQLAFDIIKTKTPLIKGLKYFHCESLPVTSASDDIQKAFIKKLSTFLATSPQIAEDLYNKYLESSDSRDASIKVNVYDATRAQSTMEKIRRLYWSERLSLIQLQKIMVSYWEMSWFNESDLLFAATGFKSYSELTQLLINQFKECHTSFADLLNKSMTTKHQAQTEHLIDAKLLQSLQEIELTLQAILISLSGESKASDAQNLFSSLLEVFWEVAFFSKKELSCLPSSCRSIVDKIRNLQCFILIKASHLDDITTSAEAGKDHFLGKNYSRLLASVSGLSKVQANAPLMLMAAVCGQVFGVSENELATASGYALTAIQELDVFNYLCEALQESSSPSKGTSIVPSFDYLMMPESLSVVSFCSHSAIFDLLALLARQIALDSLGSHRTDYTRVLAKTLSTVVHCSGNVISTGSQQSRIGQSIEPVIEDLTERFPLDLNLLYVCVALLNTEAKERLPEEPEGIASLVVQLITSLPYFTERFENPNALKGSARFFQSKEKGSSETVVSLLRHHWALPLESSIPVEKASGMSNLAIKLPPGTRGVLRQDGTAVTWQHEYSIWPVLNIIVVAAEKELLGGWATDVNPARVISRVVACLDFVDACLLTKIEPAHCLAVTELVWALVTRIFTETLSGELDVSLGQVLVSLSAEHLVPCLLRLTAHCAAYAPPFERERSLVHKLSCSVFHCLQSDRIICPSVVAVNLVGSSSYSLTDSCLLRIVSSTAPKPGLLMSEVSPETAYRLVSAYLDLALGLLAAEKAVFVASGEACFAGIEDGSGGQSPLLPCLVFAYELLVEAGGSTRIDGLSILPKLLKGSPDSKSGILDIVNKAVLFFVELLSLRSVDDIYDDQAERAEGANGLSSSDAFPVDFPGLRAYAHRLLASSEAFFGCIIPLAKAPLAALQMPLYSPHFDFLRFSTRPEESQIGGMSAVGQHQVQSTWLAISLLHCLFPSPSASPSVGGVLLRCLANSDAAGSSPAFFLHLLSFLDPGCPVGLTRVAVGLLKKMVQFSDRLVLPHLHDMQAAQLLRNLFQRLRSSSTDALARTALLDWLAEAALHDVFSATQTTPACGPFGSAAGFGLLRMLSTEATREGLKGLQGLVSSLLQDVVKEDQPHRIKLYWSLLKLISALWMQPNNPFRVELREAPDFWKSLSDPFFEHLRSLTTSQAEHSVVDLEIAGNFAAIISVELFEYMKSGAKPPAAFLDVCKLFVGDHLVQWLQTAFKFDNLEEIAKSSTVESLDWALIRWKSTYSTLLKWNAFAADEKSRLVKPTHVCDLIEACLKNATDWVSLPPSRAKTSILDQLAVCLSTSAAYLAKTPSTATNSRMGDCIEAVVTLLECQSVSTPTKLSTTPKQPIYSHSHADLLAFLGLLPILVSKRDPPPLPHVYDRLLGFCLDVVVSVAALTRVSAVEAQAFVQTANVLQCIWGKFKAVKLAACLVDAGVVNNLIAVLSEYSTSFDHAEFCRSIVSLLTRFLLPQRAPRLYPDLSELSGETGAASSTSDEDGGSDQLREMFITYVPQIVQALRLPPAQKLMQWLAQPDDFEASKETGQGSLFPNTAWSELILSHLRLLTLLLVREGGAGACTPMAHLLRTYLLANHEALIALLKATALPYTLCGGGGGVSSSANALSMDVNNSNSVTAGDTAGGVAVACALLQLYWCVLHASPDATGLVSPGCVASATLFVEGHRGKPSSPDGASVSLPPEVSTSVYAASIHLANRCVALLLRPGPSERPKTQAASTASTPSATSSATTTPSTSATTTTLDTRFSVSPRLISVMRLLANCLRLVAVETPRLGDLSFASASEISALTPEAALDFSSPSADNPPSGLTFGLLLSTARTTSHIIFDVHNSKSATSNLAETQKTELMSLLVEVNELAFALIYSQATIWLMNPRIDPGDKHTLSRGLAVEFQSYNFLGRSTRRGMKPQTPGTSDSMDAASQQLNEIFTFLAFTDRFSDQLVK